MLSLKSSLPLFYIHVSESSVGRPQGWAGGWRVEGGGLGDGACGGGGGRALHAEPGVSQTSESSMIYAVLCSTRCQSANLLGTSRALCSLLNENIRNEQVSLFLFDPLMRCW